MRITKTILSLLFIISIYAMTPVNADVDKSATNLAQDSPMYEELVALAEEMENVQDSPMYEEISALAEKM